MKKTLRAALIRLLTISVLLSSLLVGTAFAVSTKNAVMLDIPKQYIKDCGNQQSSGKKLACQCYAFAYARIILDNAPHQWTDYRAYGQTAKAPSAAGFTWYRTESEQEALKNLYDNINAGRPVILQVYGRNNPYHFVVGVGYDKDTDPDSLSQGDFIVLDTWSGKYQLLSSVGQGKGLRKNVMKETHPNVYANLVTEMKGVKVLDQTEAVTYYTVTFDANGGALSGSEQIKYAAGTELGTLPTPTRTGYSFTGWAPSRNVMSSDGAVTTATKVTADITLYAQWALKSTVTVKHSENGVWKVKIPFGYKANLYDQPTDLFSSGSIPANPGRIIDCTKKVILSNDQVRYAFINENGNEKWFTKDKSMTEEVPCHHESYQTVQKKDGTYTAVCKNCGQEFQYTEESVSRTCRIKQEIYLCSAPYQDAKTEHLSPEGTVYTIASYADNAYGNRWYKIEEGLWIFADYLEDVEAAKAESTLAFDNLNAPTSLKVGDYFSLKGTVKSNYEITSVKGEIVSDAGEVVCKYTQKPNAKKLTLLNSDLDYHMTFNELSAGTYILRYTAKDSSGNSIEWSSDPFVVGKASSSTTSEPEKTPDKTETTQAEKQETSTLSIMDPNAPTSLTVGDYFSLKGTVKSNYEITSVKGEIVNDAGEVVCKYTQKPNAKSFSILNSDLDLHMTFNELSAGSYYLRYTAKDSSGNSVEWTSAPFTVKKSTKESTLAIKNANAPTKLSKGDYFSLKGKVTSNYTITSIKGEIISEDGKVACKYTAKPNATSYTILNSELDTHMTFNKLAKGKYYLHYTAKDSSGNTVEWTSDTFTVK